MDIRKEIWCGYIPLQVVEEPAKSCVIHGLALTKLLKKQSDCNYRIEKLQGRRDGKVVHFD